MSIAIRAEGLSKEYRLGIINHGVLFRDIQSWIAKKRGLPDPHSKLGSEHFSERPDRFWALKDLSFEIEQGDRVGIIGRNGAGKSTLLKILSRITEPTEGLVKIRGRVASLLEVGTGFHPELTGRDNIYLSGAIRGMKKREIDRKIDEIIDFSEIEKFIDTPVKRYSSGMYVRLGFAVAAHLESEILLADEVLAVGDQAFQEKCLGKMKDVSAEEGRTVLFVSHNLASVASLCGKGIVLDHGTLKFSGGIDEATAQYTRESVSSIIQYSDGIIREAQAKQTPAGIEIKVRYSESAKVDVPCLGIKLYTDLGDVVFSCNPYNYQNQKDLSIKESNTIIALITNPPLYNGEYYLTLVFANSLASLEKREKCLKLEIHNMVETKFPPSIKQHGAIHPVCSYRYS